MHYVKIFFIFLLMKTMNLPKEISFTIYNLLVYDFYP